MCFDVALTHGLDSEVKGFVTGVKGAFKCSLSLASEGAYGDAVRAVSAKDRVSNTEHEPLAFEC
jgi:hypothetical protein